MGRPYKGSPQYFPNQLYQRRNSESQGQLSHSEIEQLAQLINRSVVSTSKLLHFVNPEAFAIWDSRIYRFIYYEQAPHQNRVNNARAYERYLGLLHTLRQDVRFPTLPCINRKVGYPVSALRAIEVVMFLNAPRVGFHASAEQ